ncbi:MAG: FAD-dependent oxidoreductase [Rhodobacteraceae bacterium]|jgi:3-phenylpropionate/trans-cinnamate dioxygenase ferredoxin reductase component|nr:FAD-dependent oxidoreductase [Paracoccaceae bacterium]MBT6633639.1 FAD-dependent oxidoreductase [Gammaproteobacteria bacterium]|tara:strand:+ start:6895 stop:8106 length:1212 start_codon:yes stop_codon:yes gene_type:complete
MSVVIIGAGHAGTTAAATLRKLNKDIKISLFSDERSVPYQRPPLSKKTIFSDTQNYDLILGKDFYDKNDIQLNLDSAVEEINPKQSYVRLNSKEIIEYDQLIIATGTKGYKLNIPGGEQAQTLYSINDAHKLANSIAKAKKIAVIGGGFIGCEIASGVQKLNKDVTLLETGPSILGRSVAPIFAESVSKIHHSQGIKILTNCKALSINNRGVETTSSIISADLVVAGIGVTPNIELATEANLDIDNGILVNKLLQTSNENIFAIGDIANFPFQSDSGRLRLESIQNASEQAKIAAKNIIALRNNQKLQSYSPIPWFWSDQGDLKLQMAGVGKLNAKHHVLENQNVGTLTVLHLVDGQLVAIDTLNHGVNHICGRKLLSYKKPILMDDIKRFKGDLKSLVKELN